MGKKAVMGYGPDMSIRLGRFGGIIHIPENGFSTNGVQLNPPVRNAVSVCGLIMMANAGMRTI